MSRLFLSEDERRLSREGLESAERERDRQAERAARLEAQGSEVLEALKKAVDLVETYYGYYEQEFRVSGDPPDAEYESVMSQIRAVVSKSKKGA